MISPYYINLMGKYGNRMQDYLNLGDLLSHMDRLGIWQTTATCLRGNVRESNRALLADLEKTPGAKERIIPAFLAEPHIYVSNGEMEHLTMCLREHSPACIRLQPMIGQYRLREMEQVLLRLEEFHPVILLDKREMTDIADIDDLIYLANRFPTMRFVVQQIFWSKLHFVFDAMQRAENICIDIGWMQNEQGIPMLCKHLGEDRVLFSLSYRANHGAAIAGLCYADLSQQQKDAIAAENFINLFHNETDRAILRARRRSIPNRVANSFWNRFLEEKPLGVRVIDSHTHISPHLGQWFAPQNDMAEATPLFRQKMERLGIELSIISQPGRWHEDPRQPNYDLLEVTRNHTDCMKGYLTFIPDSCHLYTREYLDEMFATGFYIGFKSMPEYYQVSICDERYDTMFRYAQEHDLPILLHSGGVHGDIRLCGEAVAKWPGVKLILGHSGGADPGRLACHEVAQNPKYDGLYFEFCGSFMSTISWKESLKYIDYRRFLFGTDANLHDAAWELGRLLSEDIPDEQLEAILGGNAMRMFGLS